jgi:hypothetical protein
MSFRAGGLSIHPVRMLVDLTELSEFHRVFLSKFLRGEFR